MLLKCSSNTADHLTPMLDKVANLDVIGSAQVGLPASMLQRGVYPCVGHALFVFLEVPAVETASNQLTTHLVACAPGQQCNKIQPLFEAKPQITHIAASSAGAGKEVWVPIAIDAHADWCCYWLRYLVYVATAAGPFIVCIVCMSLRSDAMLAPRVSCCIHTFVVLVLHVIVPRWRGG